MTAASSAADAAFACACAWLAHCWAGAGASPAPPAARAPGEGSSGSSCGHWWARRWIPADSTCSRGTAARWRGCAWRQGCCGRQEVVRAPASGGGVHARAAVRRVCVPSRPSRVCWPDPHLQLCHAGSTVLGQHIAHVGDAGSQLCHLQQARGARASHPMQPWCREGAGGSRGQRDHAQGQRACRKPGAGVLWRSQSAQRSVRTPAARPRPAEATPCRARHRSIPGPRVEGRRGSLFWGSHAKVCRHAVICVPCGC
jgi:hypothetical protein